jgi:hypothetical protein
MLRPQVSFISTSSHGKQFANQGYLNSLGWMELRTFLAKIHYMYDLEMLDEKLDWHRGSTMHTLWEKPELRARVKPRSM